MSIDVCRFVATKPKMAQEDKSPKSLQIPFVSLIGLDRANKGIRGICPREWKMICLFKCEEGSRWRPEKDVGKDEVENARFACSA